MDITLSGVELDTAITEYLLARGVQEGANFSIKIIGGRAGNKSSAKITVEYERTSEITQVSTTYAPPKELDHDPYEEEPEEPVAVAAPIGNPFAKAIETPKEEAVAEDDAVPFIEEETSKVVTPMKSLFNGNS